MTTNITIQVATPNDAPDVAAMAGALFDEIIDTTGVQVFNFNRAETTQRLRDLLEREQYFVFIACDRQAGPIGFVSMYESHALYAEGVFGTIPELYVRPRFRSKVVGHLLLERIKTFGSSLGWKRLEVTTPPLPQFDRTLAFYEREGFTISGGRKLKVIL